MASGVDQVRQAANRVNNSLMEHIVSLPDEMSSDDNKPSPLPRIATNALRESEAKSRKNSIIGSTLTVVEPDAEIKKEDEQTAPVPSSSGSVTVSKPNSDLDYGAAVGALTLHFLNEHEITRIAALAWLVMLHRKAPRKVLATNDGIFPALLKTLSDSSETVVTLDLALLSQISRNSEEGSFTSFMVDLLQLLCTDRTLLETRGNLIIRQLCMSLSAERIYRTLADCLEKDEVIQCLTEAKQRSFSAVGR